MPNTYYGGGPAQYAQQQQGNRQQQFRDLMNMMVAMQQMKYQKEQDEWGKAFDMRQFEQKQKESVASIEHAKAQTEKEKAMAQNYRRPDAPPKKAEWETRDDYATYLHEAGELDDKQYQHIKLYGKPPPDVEVDKLTTYQQYQKNDKMRANKESFTSGVGNKVDKELVRVRKMGGKSQWDPSSGMMSFLEPEKEHESVPALTAIRSAVAALENKRGNLTKAEEALLGYINQNAVKNPDEVARNVMAYLQDTGLTIGK